MGADVQANANVSIGSDNILVDGILIVQGNIYICGNAGHDEYFLKRFLEKVWDEMLS